MPFRPSSSLSTSDACQIFHAFFHNTTTTASDATTQCLSPAPRSSTTIAIFQDLSCGRGGRGFSAFSAFSAFYCSIDDAFQRTKNGSSTRNHTTSENVKQRNDRCPIGRFSPPGGITGRCANAHGRKNWVWPTAPGIRHRQQRHAVSWLCCPPCHANDQRAKRRRRFRWQHGASNDHASDFATPARFDRQPTPAHIVDNACSTSASDER